MFKKEVNSKEVESVVGPSVKIKGNFGGEGNIIVEGVIEGSLKSKSTVFINQGARVIANVKAENALIKGEVQGNIEVGQYLEIGETAKITGDIHCASLSIAPGAILNGKCQMSGEALKNNPITNEENAEEKA